MQADSVTSTSTAVTTKQHGASRRNHAAKTDVPVAEQSTTTFDSETRIEEARAQRMSRLMRLGQSSVKRLEKVIEREGSARIGKLTQNDGRADNLLASGGHYGARDARIAMLKRVQARLEQKAASVEQRIAQIDSELRSDEKISGAVGTVADIASAPIGFVAGLFGKENPVAQAARSVSDWVLGVEGERAALVDQKAILDKQRSLIATRIDQLSNEQTLNLLADVAHVTGMPPSVADALEGSGSVDAKVVDSTGLGSDAAYDSSRGAVLIDKDVIARARENFNLLKRQGIIDEDGNILDASRFDASAIGDKLIGTTALVGVHEMVHAAQDGRGEIAAAQRASGEIVAQSLMGSSDTALKAAYVKAELDRIDRLEYDAYTMQETLELQAGKEKQGFITINPDGSPLPRMQAVANIYAFTMGLPIVHGVSAGKVFGEQKTDGEPQQTPGLRSPGRRSPGRRSPGLRSPGELTYGLRSPGELTYGLRSPGELTYGLRSPGELTYGLRSPGLRSPGEELD